MDTKFTLFILIKDYRKLHMLINPDKMKYRY